MNIDEFIYYYAGSTNIVDPEELEKFSLADQARFYNELFECECCNWTLSIDDLSDQDSILEMICEDCAD